MKKGDLFLLDYEGILELGVLCGSEEMVLSSYDIIFKSFNYNKYLHNHTVAGGEGYYFYVCQGYGTVLEPNEWVNWYYKKELNGLR